MTAIGFKWMLDRTAGVLNTLMTDLGIVDSPRTGWATRRPPGPG
ncbi:hypothetical protein ACFQV4_28750 [Streptomyces thermocarboxydus]